MLGKSLAVSRVATCIVSEKRLAFDLRTRPRLSLSRVPVPSQPYLHGTIPLLA
jgi:hypothetical protein